MHFVVYSLANASYNSRATREKKKFGADFHTLPHPSPQKRRKTEKWTEMENCRFKFVCALFVNHNRYLLGLPGSSRTV